MMEEMIIQANREIAEFMGMEYRKMWKPKGCTIDLYHWECALDSPMYHLAHCNEKLRFHNDWNWIMQVVAKINSIKPFDVIIWRNDCHINDDSKILFEAVSNGNPLQAAFTAVSQFVTWYKSQQK